MTSPFSCCIEWPKKARSGMREFSVSMTCFFQVKGAKVVLSEGPPKSRRRVWSICNLFWSPHKNEEIKLNTVLSAEAKSTLSRKGIYLFCLVYDVSIEYLNAGFMHFDCVISCILITWNLLLDGSFATQLLRRETFENYLTKHIKLSTK